MGTRNRSTRTMAGILDVHVHHASGLQSLSAYGDQDVYARFLFGELDPLSDAVLQTKTIRKGGNRPNFDQSLQIGVPEGQNVLKCEVFMAQPRSRDKLLGYVKISLEDVMTEKNQKQRKPLEYQLVSSYMDAPAGTLTLTLAYHGRQPVRQLPCWRELSPGKGSPVKEGLFAGGSGAVAALRLAMNSEKPGLGLLKALGAHRNSAGPGAGFLAGGIAPGKSDLPEGNHSVQMATGRPEAVMDKTSFEWLRNMSGMKGTMQQRSAGLNASPAEFNGVMGKSSQENVDIGLALRLSRQESSGEAEGVGNFAQTGFAHPAITGTSLKQGSEANASGQSAEETAPGTRLMQLLPLGKCREEKTAAQCQSRRDVRLSGGHVKVEAVHPAGKKLGSAFKPYASHLNEAGSSATGLKRPRSASGSMLDAPLSSGAGSQIVLTPIRPLAGHPGIFNAGIASLGIGSANGNGLLSLGFHLDPSEALAKRMKGSACEPAHTAGEFSALLRGNDDDDNVRNEDAVNEARHREEAVIAPIRVVEYAQQGIRKPEAALWDQGKVYPFAGAKPNAKLGEDQVTPTSVLQQQTSEGNSWHTEGGGSEVLGATAESKSESLPSRHRPEADQSRLQEWLADGASQEAVGKGSLGFCPDVTWFSNGKSLWGQALPTGKLLPCRSSFFEQEAACSAGNGGLKFRKVKVKPITDGSQEGGSLGVGGVTTSSGSTGGDFDRVKSPVSGFDTFRESFAQVPGGTGGASEAGPAVLSQSDSALGMSETEHILHQQAAAVWQASQMLMSEHGSVGHVAMSQSQAQVWAHQQAAAMWQASMGMSKEQAEGMWQAAVAAGTITAGQAAEFRKLWAQAKPQPHLPHLFDGVEEESVEKSEDVEEQRRRGWKDFWDQLDSRRKEIAARDGYVRYGSHAFF